MFKRKTKTVQWNHPSEPRKRSEMKPPYDFVARFLKQKRTLLKMK